MNIVLADTIEREITVRVKKERVFSAISDPAQIVKWFPDRVEGTLEVGKHSVFEFEEHGKAEVLVVACDPYDYFAFRWNPGPVDYSKGYTGKVLEEPNTLVEFFLEDKSDSTVIRLKESGFASLPSSIYEKCFKDNNGGWDYMVGRLEQLLAQE